MSRVAEWRRSCTAPCQPPGPGKSWPPRKPPRLARSYEQAVASPKRELRIFTAEEGATEHIGLDHLPHVSTFIADWVADTFAELNAPLPTR